MASGKELKEEFWDKLEDSPFVMLGLAGAREAHTQPMTAQFDDDLPNRLYFYCHKDNSLIASLPEASGAVVNFSAKGHDLFACVHGTLHVDNDRAVIDKFWSPVVSAWFEGGKDDPSLTLLRVDAGPAEIWQAGTGDFLKYMAAGLFGGDASEASEDDVAKVHF